MRRRIGRAVCAGAMVAVAVASTPAPVQAEPLEPVGSQLRLTHRGFDGDPVVRAVEPAIAFNSRRREFLAVWSGNDPDSQEETDIYGQRLDAAGSPVGDVLLITTATTPVGDATVAAREPAVAYDAARDQYAVAYARTAGPLPGTASIYVSLLDGEGHVTGAPILASDDAAVSQAGEPDIVYAPGDERWLVVWSDRAGPDGAVAAIYGVLINAVQRVREGQPFRYSTPDPQSAQPSTQPTAALQPTRSGYVVAWLQRETTAPHAEVHGVLVDRQGQLAADQRQLTAVGRNGGELAAASPQIVANPQLAEMALAYSATDASDGEEIQVQRLSSTLQYAAEPVRVSSAGPRGSRHAYVARQPAISWNPGRSRYLVTWSGSDEGRPGRSDAEVELTGQVLDSQGRETGTDDFVISRMGLDGSASSSPAETPAVIAADHFGDWLVAWSGDHAVPPLADGELELWGRRIAPNSDRDYDGSPVPADCDDLDPRRRPGTPDAPGNGIDEDCSGADNLDMDADGSEPPRDCNDRNPFVRPGRRDIPGNRIDEDCSGRDTPVPISAKVRITWLFGTQSTTVRRMVVERAARGMRVNLRCSRGCVGRLAGRGRTITVRRSGRLTLTHVLRGVRLLPGARLEVRLQLPPAIGLLERYRIRSGSPPAQQTRCLDPTRRRPSACAGGRS